MPINILVELIQCKSILVDIYTHKEKKETSMACLLGYLMINRKKHEYYVMSKAAVQMRNVFKKLKQINELIGYSASLILLVIAYVVTLVANGKLKERIDM